MASPIWLVHEIFVHHRGRRRVRASAARFPGTSNRGSIHNGPHPAPPRACLPAFPLSSSTLKDSMTKLKRTCTTLLLMSCEQAAHLIGWDRFLMVSRLRGWMSSGPSPTRNRYQFGRSPGHPEMRDRINSIGQDARSQAFRVLFRTRVLGATLIGVRSKPWAELLT